MSLVVAGSIMKQIYAAHVADNQAFKFLRFSRRFAWQSASPADGCQHQTESAVSIDFTWSRDIESSRSSTFCRPSSSSSSSSSNVERVEPMRMPPKAALPPASEKGVDATAVPKTLAVFGAPNAAKSVTTLRVGDDGALGLTGEAGAGFGEE